MISEEELKNMQLDYERGLSLAKLSKIYKWDATTIYKTFKKNNIKLRSLTDSHITKHANFRFFEKIDSESKAYFLGFLYADGAITHNRMNITLQPWDIHILETFRQEMESSHKFVDDRGYARFCISNKNLYTDLLNVGCSERKSFTLDFPTEQQVPNILIRHFIRGFFDGDGSINYYKKNGRVICNFQFISTWKFNETLKDIFTRDVSIFFKEHKIHAEKRNKNLCYFGLTNVNLSRIKQIYNFLYDGANFYLFRKKDKFQEIIDILEKKVNDKSIFIENRKRILFDNRHKKLDDVVLLINYKHGYDVGDLYRKYNIKRTYARNGK